MSYTIVTGNAKQFDISWFIERYRVIIADPPWEHRVHYGNGGVDLHYAEMTDEEIISMPVAQIAAQDSVLYLWTTWAKLLVGIETIKAWDFEYVTGLPWIKLTKNESLSYGIGHWIRGCSEPLLIARRGKIKVPDELGDYVGLLSPNFSHSKKPESVHELAEKFPGPRLELFARNIREEWTLFGNELLETQTGEILKLVSSKKETSLDLW